MHPIIQIGFFSGAPGPGELIVLFVAVLLLFGPRRLPGFARSLGQIMHQIRRASNEFRDQLLSVEDEIRAEVQPGGTGDSDDPASAEEGLSPYTLVEESDRDDDDAHETSEDRKESSRAG